MKQLKGKKTTHTQKKTNRKNWGKKKTELQKRNVPFGENGTNVLIKEQS